MQFPTYFPDHEEEPLLPITLNTEDVELPAEIPDEATLEQWLCVMAEREGVPLISANYIFGSDEWLLQMNIEYLEHDYYTDIITFQDTEKAIHGDMFISIDRVADNAQQLGIPFRTELLRVMAHGALHLAGYGDKTPEDEQKMREKEEEYLKILSL